MLPKGCRKNRDEIRVKKVPNKIGWPGFILWGLLSVGGTLLAQEEPFGSMAIELSWSAEPLRQSLAPDWRTGNGIVVKVGVPFYKGEIRGGTRFRSYNANRPELPDFQAMTFFMQWSAAVLSFGKVRLSAGFSLGNFLMRFDEHPRYAGLGKVTESEVVGGLLTAVSLEPLKNWRITAELRHEQVFTRRKINLTSVSAGLTKTLDLPGWLTAALR